MSAEQVSGPATAGLIARYADRLPLAPNDPVVSLGEGSTPLVHAEKLSAHLGCEVWIKVEGANPSGSFKDRGMTVAISRALAEGATTVACASTGNTSASAAAYAAKAGMKALVLLPAGKIATGKLAQAVVYGARIVQLDGNFDNALEVARKLSENYPVALVNSVNPDRLQGQKTAAFEIVDALGDAPDLHVLPVGNAGNISAYWMGYREYHTDGLATRLPQMWGFQASGAAPLVHGHPVLNPETVATAIRIGNPASADLAKAAVADSEGRFGAVTDDQILEAQSVLAAWEGIFVEPASASGVAGLLAAHRAGDLPSGLRIAVTCTGNGLKDVDTAMRDRSVDPDVLPAEAAEVARWLGLES
ncbi:threonine synthase [Naumannella halotolerans]|uniref:Threonine synthase n=1 Tax=Naumannella halotolerans TaxID=993414 RepID=A0A4R7J853_9ACTN|nr:threonine synthase [Naumannella halotolerans]TDT33660.1 threonine synthase [Naumannella halotolerans]